MPASQPTIRDVTPTRPTVPTLTCCDGCRRLSPREVQVLCGIADGRTSRGIAEDLRISMRTVNTHREHLKQKLGVSSVAGLTRYVIEHGIHRHP